VDSLEQRPNSREYARIEIAFEPVSPRAMFALSNRRNPEADVRKLESNKRRGRERAASNV